MALACCSLHFSEQKSSKSPISKHQEHFRAGCLRFLFSDIGKEGVLAFRVSECHSTSAVRDLMEWSENHVVLAAPRFAVAVFGTRLAAPYGRLKSAMPPSIFLSQRYSQLSTLPRFVYLVHRCFRSFVKVPKAIARQTVFLG